MSASHSGSVAEAPTEAVSCFQQNLLLVPGYLLASLASQSP